MIPTRALRLRQGDDRSTESGFTLVELLVAIVLLGFIAVLAFGGLRLAFAAWRVTDRDASDPQPVQYLLRSWMAAAIPAPLLDAGGEELIAFTGEPEGLTFITRLPDRFGVPGLYRVSLALGRTANQKSLKVHWSLFQADSSLESWQAEETEAHEQVTLIKNVGSVRFRYFGTLADDEDPAWHDRWVERPWLPQLLVLEVGYRPDDGRRWPTLIVAPRLDAVQPRGERSAAANSELPASGQRKQYACRDREQCG